jgi:phasin family protein
MNNTFEKLVAPIKELNELALNSIQEIAAVQIKTIQENAKISANSLKAASEIKDLDGLKDYLSSQVATAQSVSENAVEDANEITKLSEAYTAKVQEVVKKSVPTV